MGCSGEAQAVKDQMMLLKLKRMEIQMEKEKEIKKLSDIEGRPIKAGIIPDYIDPEFAREQNLATDYINMDDEISQNNKKEAKKEKYKEKNKKDKIDKKKGEKNKKEKSNKKKKEKNKKDKKEDKKNKKKK